MNTFTKFHFWKPGHAHPTSWLVWQKLKISIPGLSVIVELFIFQLHVFLKNLPEKNYLTKILHDMLCVLTLLELGACIM